MAILIGASGSFEGRVSAWTILPSSRAATAMHNDAVSGNARCGWPPEIMRPVRSTLAASIFSPVRVDASCGPETKPMKGTTRFAFASSRLVAMPMAIDAAMRMAPSRSSSSVFASSASGISVPVMPSSSARTKQHALAASIMDT